MCTKVLEFFVRHYVQLILDVPSLFAVLVTTRVYGITTCLGSHREREAAG